MIRSGPQHRGRSRLDYVRAVDDGASSERLHINLWATTADGGQPAVSPYAPCRYESLPAGRTLAVFTLNGAQSHPHLIPSELVLRTVGSETAFERLSLGGAAQQPRMQHCAHFQGRRMCTLGPDCNFIHSKLPPPPIRAEESSHADPLQVPNAASATAVAPEPTWRYPAAAAAEYPTPASHPGYGYPGYAPPPPASSHPYGYPGYEYPGYPFPPAAAVPSYAYGYPGYAPTPYAAPPAASPYVYGYPGYAPAPYAYPYPAPAYPQPSLVPVARSAQPPSAPATAGGRPTAAARTEGRPNAVARDAHPAVARAVAAATAAAAAATAAAGVVEVAPLLTAANAEIAEWQRRAAAADRNAAAARAAAAAEATARRAADAAAAAQAQEMAALVEELNVQVGTATAAGAGTGAAGETPSEQQSSTHGNTTVPTLRTPGSSETRGASPPTGSGGSGPARSSESSSSSVAATVSSDPPESLASDDEYPHSFTTSPWILPAVYGGFATAAVAAPTPLGAGDPVDAARPGGHLPALAGVPPQDAPRLIAAIAELQALKARARDAERAAAEADAEAEAERAARGAASAATAAQSQQAAALRARLRETRAQRETVVRLDRVRHSAAAAADPDGDAAAGATVAATGAAEDATGMHSPTLAAAVEEVQFWRARAASATASAAAAHASAVAERAAADAAIAAAVANVTAAAPPARQSAAAEPLRHPSRPATRVVAGADAPAADHATAPTGAPPAPAAPLAMPPPAATKAPAMLPPAHAHPTATSLPFAGKRPIDGADEGPQIKHPHADRFAL